MSFLHMESFPSLPNTPHKVAPYFVDFCFRFAQIQLFFFLFPNFIIDLKLSSMLIDYILFWYIMSTFPTKTLNYNHSQNV